VLRQGTRDESVADGDDQVSVFATDADPALGLYVSRRHSAPRDGMTVFSAWCSATRRSACRELIL
jgi:hypothetical protein